MARSVRSKQIETRTNRLRLPADDSIVYVSIGDGLSLGYRRKKKGNGSWQVRLRKTGGGYLKHGIGEADDFMEANNDTVLTFYQAQEKAREFAKEARQPFRPTDKPITVEKAAKHYMDWYRNNRKDIKGTQCAIDTHILPVFGTKLVMELTSLEIRRWHEKLASSPPRRRTRAGDKQAFGEKPTSSERKRSRRSTANRIMTVLKAILNRAFQDELVADDSAWRRVKPFPNTDEPITRFLTEGESRRLINACRPDFRLLIKAALFTGCRYSELVRLQVKDINLDTGLIYVSADAKSNKGRHVPLSAEGLQFFREITIGMPGTADVFTRKDGGRWGKNHQSRLMGAACEQAKIEPAIGFHELRHTYASLLAQAGADLLTISKLLGHADTRITSRHYAHLCDKTLAKAVQDLLPSFGHQTENAKVRAISG